MFRSEVDHKALSIYYRCHSFQIMLLFFRPLVFTMDNPLFRFIFHEHTVVETA